MQTGLPKTTPTTPSHAWLARRVPCASVPIAYIAPVAILTCRAIQPRHWHTAARGNMAGVASAAAAAPPTHPRRCTQWVRRHSMADRDTYCRVVLRGLCKQGMPGGGRRHLWKRFLPKHKLTGEVIVVGLQGHVHAHVPPEELLGWHLAGVHADRGTARLLQVATPAHASLAVSCADRGTGRWLAADTSAAKDAESASASLMFDRRSGGLCTWPRA